MVEYLTIEEGVLTKCKQDVSGTVVIPEGVTKIRWFAFEECTDLTSVKIPSSVTEIGEGAFNGCNNLDRTTLARIKEIQGK